MLHNTRFMITFKIYSLIILIKSKCMPLCTLKRRRNKTSLGSYIIGVTAVFSFEIGVAHAKLLVRFHSQILISIRLLMRREIAILKRRTFLTLLGHIRVKVKQIDLLWIGSGRWARAVVARVVRVYERGLASTRTARVLLREELAYRRLFTCQTARERLIVSMVAE